MASSWTVALTYEVMKKLAAQLKDYDPNYADHLQTIVSGHFVKQILDKYFLSSGNHSPGFVYMEDLPEHVELDDPSRRQKDTDSVPTMFPMQQSIDR